MYTEYICYWIYLWKFCFRHFNEMIIIINVILYIRSHTRTLWGCNFLILWIPYVSYWNARISYLIQCYEAVFETYQKNYDETEVNWVERCKNVSPLYFSKKHNEVQISSEVSWPYQSPLGCIAFSLWLVEPLLVGNFLI